MDFATKVKGYRKRNGWTQQEVAQKLAISRKTVSSWENNHSYPDIFMLVQLSDLYQVSLDDLLREDHKMIKNYQEEHVANVKRGRHFRFYYACNAIACLWILLRLTNLFLAPNAFLRTLNGVVAGLAIINLVFLLANTNWEELQRETKVSFAVTLVITFCLLLTIGLFTPLTSANINYVSGVITGRIVAEIFFALCLTSLITLYPQFKERRDK